MAKREPLMSESYFEKQIQAINDEIQYYKQTAQNPTPTTKLNLVYFNICVQYRKLLTASYSAGKPVEQLLPLYAEWVSYLDQYKQRPEAQNIFFVKDADEYLDALMLVSMGLLLRTPKVLFDQMVQLVDSEKIRDGLLDTLIVYRQSDRPISSTLAFPKLYTPLFEAINQQPIALKLIQAFLGKWYKTCLKATSTYNLHTLHGGVDSGFDGYWAWEVAGLTYALNTDDSSYQDMPYYPKDLVAYARQ